MAAPADTRKRRYEAAEGLKGSIDQQVAAAASLLDGDREKALELAEKARGLRARLNEHNEATRAAALQMGGDPKLGKRPPPPPRKGKRGRRR
jgi:hypothetical protein